MGQDYSAAAYKKIYSEEYVQTYTHKHGKEGLYTSSRQAKANKGGVNDAVPTIVTASPPSRMPVNRPQPQAQVKPQPILKQAPLPKPTMQAKPQASAPVQIPVEKKNTMTEYSYIDPNSLESPVIALRDNQYRNRYTEQIIEEDEAKYILFLAGYSPKKMIKIFHFFILFLLLVLPLKIIGPFILLLIGSNLRKKEETVYNKKVNGFPCTFRMPSDETQIQEYNTRGLLYIVMAVIAGILQFTVIYN